MGRFQSFPGRGGNAPVEAAAHLPMQASTMIDIQITNGAFQTADDGSNRKLHALWNN